MAHDSAQRTRIIPAIPLKFKTKQSNKAPTTPTTDTSKTHEYPLNHVERTVATSARQPTAPPVNVPLTPESIPSVPAYNHDEETSAQESDKRNENQQHVNLDRATSLATTVNGKREGEAESYAVDGHTPDVRDLGEGSSRLIPEGDPESHQTSAKPNGYSEQVIPSSRSHSEQNGLGKQISEYGSSVPAHQGQPSASSLVFGSMEDDLSSSAVTFTSPRHQTRSSRSSMMVNNVNAAPFFPADLQSPLGYTPIELPTYDPYSPTQAWYPEAPQWSAVAPHYTQPLSPSLSQHSSTRAADNAFRAAPVATNGSEPPSTGAAQVVTPEPLSTIGHLDTTNGLNDHTASLPLQDYMLSQLGQVNYADCLLEFFLPSNILAPVRIPAHRLLAARSPRLASELVLGSPAEYDPFGLRIVRVWAQSKHVTPDALMETLRYLYGAPLPAIDALSTEEINDPSFVRAIAIAAAGRLLGIPEVEEHGLTNAKQHLSWAHLELLYAYLHETHENPEAPALRSTAIETIAENFPKDFIFDTRAAQLVDAPRLPEISGSRPSTSDPRLSRIQFGEVDESNGQSEPSTLASSLLISLPFDELKRLFEHEGLRHQVGASSLGHLQQAVVDERERRRIKAQRSKRRSAVPNEPQDPSLLENVLWVEQLDRSFDGSLILSRTCMEQRNGH